MVNFSRIFRPSSPSQTPESALILEKKVVGSRSYEYVKVFNDEQRRVEELPLKKAAFTNLSSLKYVLKNAWQGKKIVTLDVHDPETNKYSKYFARVDDISYLATGSTDAEKSKEVGKKNSQELTKEIMTRNADAIETIKREAFLIKDSAPIARQLTSLENSIQNKLDLLQSVQDKHKIIRPEKGEYPLLANANVFFDYLVSQIIELPLANIQKQYNLNEEQMGKLKILNKFVPAENLEAYLKSSENKKDSIRILNTFYRAADAFSEGGIPKENLYFKKKFKDTKKESQSYSFTVTSSCELIIAKEKLAEGAFKKVSSAVNLNNLEKIVKKVVRISGNVENALKEEALQRILYEEKPPYILPPTKISVLTRIEKEWGVKNKYVFFETRMKGDGRSISSKNLSEVAQFCHDYAKGLQYMHEKGFVHSDVKPDNGLIKDGRAMVCDFGLSGKIKNDQGLPQPIKGGTLYYLPPEYFIGEAPLDPSLDSYSLGVMLLEMIDPRLDLRLSLLGKDSLGFLDFNQRKGLFEQLKRDAERDTNLSDKETEQKIALLNMADIMTSSNKNERRTCGDFAKEIARVFENQIKTSDPVV